MLEWIAANATSGADQKAGKTYKACMNETLRNAAGTNPLKNTLKQIGGWPILEGNNWNTTWREAVIDPAKYTYTWHEHVLMMEKNNYYVPSRGIVTYDIQLHPDNRSSKMFVLEGPYFNLYNKYFLKDGLNNNKTKEYFELMVQAAVMLGATEDQARKELNESLAFEIALAQLEDKAEHFPHKRKDFPHKEGTIVWDPVIRNLLRYDGMDNRTTVTIINQIPEALGSNVSLPGHPPNWAIFFDRWLRNYEVDEYVLNVDGTQAILLPSTEYLVNMSEIITNYENKSRVIANYLGWLVVEEGIKLLDNQSQSLKNQLQSVSCQNQLTGRRDECHRLSEQIDLPLWTTCVSYHLGFGNPDSPWAVASGSMYARGRESVGTDYKPMFTRVVRKVRNAISQIIRGADWMDSTTREKAVTKMDSMTVDAAYPDDLLNQTFVDSWFEGRDVYYILIFLFNRTLEFIYDVMIYVSLYSYRFKVNMYIPSATFMEICYLPNEQVRCIAFNKHGVDKTLTGFLS